MASSSSQVPVIVITPPSPKIDPLPTPRMDDKADPQQAEGGDPNFLLPPPSLPIDDGRYPLPQSSRE